jgi:hypothetical protein
MRQECPGCEKWSNFCESHVEKDGGKVFECDQCGFIVKLPAPPKKGEAKLKENK